MWARQLPRTNMNPDALPNNQNQNIPNQQAGELIVPTSTTTSPDVAPVQTSVIQPTNSAKPNNPPTATNNSTSSKSNPNSTQNTLLINEIRDGVVIMNDGSFRAVVMLKAVNFDLMSPQEQEAVEYSYQGFLNSLYFPVQIFVHSQKIDIGPYITRLSKTRSQHDNMLLALLMDDYIDFVIDVSEQTNIMDKKFYMVIPFFPQADAQKAVKAGKNFFTGIFGQKDQTVTINEADLQKAIEELKNRTQAVLSGLEQCGVQGLPLDTQELIELYYNAYNPDTATRQQLRNFDDLTASVVTKGQGPAPNLNQELGG